MNPYQKTKDKYSLKCCNCGEHLYQHHKEDIDEIMTFKKSLKQRVSDFSGCGYYDKEQDDGLVDCFCIRCYDCADITLHYYIDGTFTLTEFDDYNSWGEEDYQEMMEELK